MRTGHGTLIRRWFAWLAVATLLLASNGCVPRFVGHWYSDSEAVGISCSSPFGLRGEMAVTNLDPSDDTLLVDDRWKRFGNVLVVRPKWLEKMHGYEKVWAPMVRYSMTDRDTLLLTWADLPQLLLGGESRKVIARMLEVSFDTTLEENSPSVYRRYSREAVRAGKKRYRAEQRELRAAR